MTMGLLRDPRGLRAKSPLFLSLLAAAACADAGADAGAGPPATLSLPWQADTANAVRIDALEGDGPDVFGSIGAVMVGKDGRIYVVDSQASEVRVFSPAGEFLARFGRPGEGPGEFALIGGIGRGPGDSIAVRDDMRSSVSVFAADGTFSRSFRLERAYRVVGSGVPVRFSANGAYHDVAPLSREAGVTETGVIRYTPGGAPADTVHFPPYEPPSLTVRNDAGLPMVSFKIPEAPREVSTVGADGSVYVAMSDAYLIRRIAPSGDTVGVLRRDVAPHPMPAVLRDSMRAALVEAYTGVVGSAPRQMPDLPEHFAPIVALHADEAGNLWVQRPDDEWDVFDAADAYAGTIQLPPMSLLHFGERTVAGVVADELGVQQVMVIPIHGRN